MGLHLTRVASLMALAVGSVCCVCYGGLVAVAPCSARNDAQWWKTDANGRIIHISTGKCLDVQSAKNQSGTPVQLYDCQDDGRANQKWKLSSEKKQIIGLGGFCLSIRGQCNAIGSNVEIAACSGDSSDMWSFDAASSKMSISNLGNSLCMVPVGMPPADPLRATPLIFGHRGLPARFPENTFVSFKGALDAGADGFETDLRFTVDGQIVLSHDDSLDRTTNCSGKINTLKFDYITKRCDAGLKKGKEWEGNFVPSFESAVKLAAERGKGIVMDMKVEGLAEEVKRILNKYNFKNAIASMWTQTQLEDMKKVNPTIPRQRLTSAFSGQDPAYFASEIAQGVSGYSISYTNVTQTFLYNAHRSLMHVVGWTIDSMSDINYAFARGFDGIITNDCELALWMALDARSKWVGK
eukprot:TRINITY_DN20396_c0_g1_i1.p1 TRINITY_DN20396_c0_g1~~TRINITY_DN20396_c0_g1_i1.p1  ORF type:complete len:410 (+),score=101.62 TRINITY_DN20396_c0_g1_i1:6-1235(+)